MIVDNQIDYQKALDILEPLAKSAYRLPSIIDCDFNDCLKYKEYLRST